MCVQNFETRCQHCAGTGKIFSPVIKEGQSTTTKTTDKTYFVYDCEHCNQGAVLTPDGKNFFAFIKKWKSELADG